MLQNPQDVIMEMLFLHDGRECGESLDLREWSIRDVLGL